jgi:hypothetical protein
MLVGCATAPRTSVIGIATEQSLSSVRSSRATRIEQYVDAKALRAAHSVGLPEVSSAHGALITPITEVQAQLVENHAGRELCVNVGQYFRIDPNAPDLFLRVVLTQLNPTSPAASGVSAVMGVMVPGPFRLPAGLGGLAAEGSAQSADGKQRLVKRWSKGANAIMDDEMMSAIGDAYQLADSFADDFARTLVQPLGAQTKARAKLDRKTREVNRQLCDQRFGRASLVGRGASMLLPLSPEAIDQGAPAQLLLLEDEPGN